MDHEDGYCDRCACETAEVWLTFDGAALCRDCAIDNDGLAVKGAKRPEARDDGY